jgi:hypothetical protein
LQQEVPLQQDVVSEYKPAAKASIRLRPIRADLKRFISDLLELWQPVLMKDKHAPAREPIEVLS